jgi:hypothetical protein
VGVTVTEKSRKREFAISNEVTQVLVVILMVLITALAAGEMRTVAAAIWTLLAD